MDKVYIVIVNYNTFRDTIECLESVLKSTYKNFQIFVVDNSSDNTSADALSNWIINNNYEVNTDFKHLVFPLEKKPLSHIVVLEADFNDTDEIYDEKIIIMRAANKGFAAANNIALNYILQNGHDTSLVWILNNDTVVEKSTLNNLVGFYQHTANRMYIAGSTIRDYNNPRIIQSVAGNYNKWMGKHRHIGEGEEDTGQYDNYIPRKMDYVVGASLFLPKLFLEKAGVMCEDYFLYFEELDWMKTGLKYGYSMALVPDAIVYHKEGASIISGNNNKNDLFLAEYYSITSRIRFIKKWYPYCLVTVMIGVTFALIKRIMQGKFSLVKKTSIAIIRILFTKF
ncbi:MAG TPA: glycosyltransferase family 2 protein [Hanamia sp.]